MPRVPLLLIKEQVLVAHEAHFAGGIHLFNSLATTLSRYFIIHVFTTASRSLVMHHAITNGLLGKLQSTYNQGEVVSWTNSSGVRFHAAVTPESNTAPANQHPIKTSTAYEALIAATMSVAAEHQFKCKLLLDVDSLQHAIVCSSNSNYTLSCHSSNRYSGSAVEECKQQQQHQDQMQFNTATADGSKSQPFMYALTQQLKPHLPSRCSNTSHSPQHQQQQQQRCDAASVAPSNTPCQPSNAVSLLVLVQNVHQLPFGPCGTAPRTIEVLQAWRQVTGVVCVSHFVQGYLEQHVLPLIGLSSERVYVMHPAAVGAFGKGPWPDLGTVAAHCLWGDHGLQQQQPAAQQQQQQEEEEVPQQRQGIVQQRRQQQQQEEMIPQQQQQEEVLPQERQQKPVIGMLKCSREKGSYLFFPLAKCLPEYNFLAVCADPELMYPTAAAAGGNPRNPPAAAPKQFGLTNLRLIRPEADVSSLLQQMTVVLVPSVLHEAFGLVVLDAMLCGIPVITSEAGALAEAAAGAAAAVVPTALVEFPPPAAAAAAEGMTSQYSDDADTGGSAARAGVATQPEVNTAAAAAMAPSRSVQQHTPQQNIREHDHHQQLVAQWIGAVRHWHNRVFPRVDGCDLEPWVAALKHVLSSRAVYLGFSIRGMEVAQGIVGSAEQQLSQLVEWLSLC